MDEGRIEENPVSNKIRRIRTGGQSGVDRAALDVARELNIEIFPSQKDGISVIKNIEFIVFTGIGERF